MSGHGRPTRSRVTWLELVLGVGITGVVVAGAVFAFAPSAQLGDGDLAIRDAQRIRDAAVEWREREPTGCPTLTQLKHERRLASDARTADPWGGRYRAASPGSGGPRERVAREHYRRKLRFGWDPSGTKSLKYRNKKFWFLN